jgi:hypothetical protein
LASAKVALTGGWLVVTVPVGSAAAVRKAGVTWYRLHAAMRLPVRTAIMAKKMGVPALLVLIRDQRRRRGRCEPKGNLRFSWRIVQAPMRLVDHVVAHELVHLAHRKHTAGFWAALGRVMPDYGRGGRRCGGWAGCWNGSVLSTGLQDAAPRPLGGMPYCLLLAMRPVHGKTRLEWHVRSHWDAEEGPRKGGSS